LAKAERELGIESDVVVYQTHSFNYSNTLDLHLNDYPLPIKILKILKFLNTSINKYDVLHFNFGRSILDYPYIFDYIDLPLIKKSRKKILITFQGCDARTKDYCLNNFEISACMECDSKCISENKKRRRFQKAEKYADHIFVLNPDLKYYFLSPKFLPYANVDLSEWVSLETNTESQIVNILHAPSSRLIKGTRYVLEVCHKLKREGYPINLQLLENIPHSRIYDYFIHSDIVIDQLLCGWYGGLAVEAMACKKPVLSYIREQDLDNFVPFKEDIPVINTNKETLYQNLISLIEDKNKCNKIGKKSRKFVEKYHNPKKIAKDLIDNYYI
jgi:glycosyltransferase involved in cell wall biosynthesis